jgi:hypothetical protein
VQFENFVYGTKDFDGTAFATAKLILVVLLILTTKLLNVFGFFQYCLSSDPNRPCYVLRFKEITLMLDCGLSTQTVLNFLPLPLVPSARLNNLQGWMPRDVSDPQLEGVSVLFNLCYMAICVWTCILHHAKE